MYNMPPKQDPGKESYAPSSSNRDVSKALVGLQSSANITKDTVDEIQIEATLDSVAQNQPITGDHEENLSKAVTMKFESNKMTGDNTGRQVDSARKEPPGQT